MKYWLVLMLLGLAWTPGMAQDRMKIGVIDVRRVARVVNGAHQAGYEAHL